jgi:hypothetical protein
MVWLQVLKLPEASVALQVRVMVLLLGHDPDATASVNVMVTELQTSVAVALPVAEGAELVLHWIVVFAGQVMEGGVTSRTVTCAVHWLWFPL